MKERFIDLQLFTVDLPAGSVDKKSANTSTYEGKSAEEKAVYEYVDRALVKSIYDELTLDKYFDNIPLPKNAGKTVKTRKLLKYDAKVNDLIEGVIPAEDAPQGIVDYQIHVGSLGGYTTFTDDLEIFSIDNGNVARITDEQGASVGEKLNMRYRDILYSTTNVWFAGVASTYLTDVATARAHLTAFDLDELRKIGTFFKRMHVQPYAEGAYVVLLPPEVEQSLLTLKKDANNFTFVEIQNYRQNNMKEVFPGEIGSWMNFRFVSENALGHLTDEYGNVVLGGTNNDKEVFGCIILGKYKGHKGASVVKLEGYGKPQVIIKDVSEGGAKENPLNQIGSVGWKMKGFGGAVLYDEAVMRYECLADMDQIVYDEDEISKARAEFKGGSTGAVTGSHELNAYNEIVPEAAAAISQGSKNGIIQGEVKALSYAITFNKGNDSASGSMSATTAVANALYTLPACTFTYSSHTFAGWKLGGSDVVKPAGAKIRVTDDIALVATWEASE